MKPSKLLKTWLLLVVCGVSHPFFVTEETDYIDSGNDHFDRSSRYSNYPLDYSGHEYSMDQPNEMKLKQSVNSHPDHRSSGHRNSSSHVKPPRHAGHNRHHQSSPHQSSPYRRHLPRRPVGLLNRQRGRNKSKDVDNEAGYETVDRVICPSNITFQYLDRALTQNKILVDVYQPSKHSVPDLGGWEQAFQVDECLDGVGYRECPGCCKGIDHSRYSSSCTQRMSFVQALVKLPQEKEFYWSHIEVKSGCRCEINPLTQP